MAFKKLFILICMLCSNLITFSQNAFFSKIYIEPAYYYGSVLPQTNYIGYLLQDHIQAFQLNIGINTNGSKKWHKYLNYPRLGLGYYHSNLGNNNVFGFLNSYYGTVAIKTFRPKYFINIEHNLNAGIAYVTMKYDIYKNSFDIPLGSHYNFYLQYALVFPIKLTKTIEIYGGACFTHISAANIIEPNHGLNMALIRLGSRFNFKPVEYKNEGEVQTHYDTIRHLFTIVVASGIKQYSRYTNDKYWVYAITPEYCYKISPVFGMGGGIDLYYDNSVKPYLLEYKNEKARLNQLLHSTAHLTFQLYIGQLSFLVQPGCYIYKNFDMYQESSYKFGFRYQFLEHFSAGILLKTHWLAQADVLEFGISCTL